MVGNLQRLYTRSGALSALRFHFVIVIPLGLEPKTHTLKVYCSTTEERNHKTRTEKMNAIRCYKRNGKH